MLFVTKIFEWTYLISLDDAQQTGGFTTANYIWDMMRTRKITPTLPAVEAYYKGLKVSFILKDSPEAAFFLNYFILKEELLFDSVPHAVFTFIRHIKKGYLVSQKEHLKIFSIWLWSETYWSLKSLKHYSEQNRTATIGS